MRPEGGVMRVQQVTTCDDVAAAIVDMSGPMPTMKLQKLVYYVQAWHVARYDLPAFDEEIEAWANGPVIDRLYQQHRTKRSVSHWTSGDPTRLDARTAALVRYVVTRYGCKSGDELSALTHSETPWLTARRGLEADARSRRVIPLEAMREYYGSQLLDPEAASRYAVANAALEGIQLPDGFEWVLEGVAAGVVDADQVVQEIVAAYAPER